MPILEPSTTAFLLDCGTKLPVQTPPPFYPGGSNALSAKEAPANLFALALPAIILVLVCRAPLMS